MKTRLLIRMATAVSVGALGAAALSSPVSADKAGPGGTAGPGNLEARAEIRVSGHVKGGRSGTTTVSAPAICWWEKSDVSGDSIESIALIFQVMFGINLDQKALDQLKKDEEAGKTFEWYQRKTSPTASPAQLEAAGCNDFSGPYRGLFIGLLLRPFEPGNPPEPIPDPEEMADVAMENIDLEGPELNWNPKADSLGGGTLVNLPTWFWVTNPEPAVGDAGGERRVTATADAGGQQMTVTVTAKASKLQIASPAGAASCSIAQARTVYASGTPQSSACTLTFQRASTAYEGGFPVRATVAWTASWRGTGPGVPAGEQQLDGVVMDSTTNVPVRESQALVKGAS
ncbi:hypothetical protein [Aeromicrobium wangtongii]|uniref:Secreted protein n=1 Tax=Aeromicrobium wangtongii TaxID=2969247 RepID=A0ABY5M620_9ACTN|nr:hypothetical protein [Aeromicrobium wangtongii]MCD9198576.1 hypothetical protein [Aeromicrobium wangtongii]UUP12601.1 hypothetical protein NQV15_12130 [Aeromicrobium wangtongii]